MRALIAKVGPELRKALESAAGLTMSRTHYEVEVEHVLLKLLDQPRNDVGCILAWAEMDGSRLAARLQVGLDRLKTGNQRTPSFSPTLFAVLKDAWMVASVSYGEAAIRTGHFFLASLVNETSRAALVEQDRDLAALSTDELEANLNDIVRDSVEETRHEAEGPVTLPSDEIFVCYRRSDHADVAGRIYDRLAHHFGPTAVFRDTESIPLGVDFSNYLRERVAASRVVVAIIGPAWNAKDGSEARLSSPTDFVRIEIEAALEANLTVIPTFVGGASEQDLVGLPGEIGALASRQGLRVRGDPDFSRDVDRLIRGISHHLGLEGTLTTSRTREE